MKEFKLKFAGVIALLAWCLALPLAAQEKAVVASTNLHSLWKVEGKSNTVYLLGSIHLLKEENYPLAAPLEAAYSNSPALVFEVDPDQMENPLTQLKLLGKGKLPDGETLKTRLAPETYASFAKHAQATGIPISGLEGMKPGFAAMILSVMELNNHGFNPENGVDRYFSKKGKADGKTASGLETVDFQIDLVTGFSKEEDDMIVKESMDDLDHMKDKFGEIITAWKTGDAAGLEKLLNEFLEKSPSLYKRLLTDRNHSWIPKIEEFLKGDKNVAVIVGAAHLVGKEGVVELLKKKGMKVTQL